MMRFTIEDTRPGVPADKADFIFEKFTKIDMFTDGLGLGLFLCRRVVELMGGTLTLDPQYTNGSRFVLELPPQITKPHRLWAKAIVHWGPPCETNWEL